MCDNIVLKMNSRASSKADLTFTELVWNRLTLSFFPIYLQFYKNLSRASMPMIRTRIDNRSYSNACVCEKISKLAHSCNEYDNFDRIFASVPIIWTICWSLTMPMALNTITASTSYNRIEKIKHRYHTDNTMNRNCSHILKSVMRNKIFPLFDDNTRSGFLIVSTAANLTKHRSFVISVQ